MPRLYVGGLSHTVTQKDLKDRFGKFGDVQDVELRTRRDDNGVPYKTFGYININISEADLKKCLSVLNKSKWKGGTLQVETAKESFLHRLAEERQEAELQRLQPPTADDLRQKLLDSLTDAGVENFTMKSAVPGTEVPGHKDWVVTKFGRVLPVLQLRYHRGSKARTLKYDPSKYSHNIRKLDRAADPDTPVTQLTWKVEGGDDDISKKRRGEFLPYVPPKRKKVRRDINDSQNEQGRNRSDTLPPSAALPAARPLSNGFKPLTKYAQLSSVTFNGNDPDSDEEIRAMVATQGSSHDAVRQQQMEEEDHLEVVGVDYLGRSQQRDRNEVDYDSADTDELLASRKLTLPSRLENTDSKKKMRKKSQARKEEEAESDDEDGIPTSKKQSSKKRQKVDTPAAGTPPESTYSLPVVGLQEVTAPKAAIPVPKRGTTPDEILAVILRGGQDSSDDERKKNKKKRKQSTPLPAFQGTKGLFEMLETEEVGQEVEEEEGRSAETSQEASGSRTESKEEEEEEEDDEDKSLERAEATSSSSSDEEEEEREEEHKSPERAKATSSSNSDKEEEREEESADSESDWDYDAMFSNVMHLEISMADLLRLAEGEEQNEAPARVPKKGTTPEEILASLMTDSDDEEEEESTPMSVLQGTKAKSEDPQVEQKTSETEESSGEEEEEVEKKCPSKVLGISAQRAESSSSSSSSDEDVEEKMMKTKAAAAETSSSSSSSEDEAELDSDEDAGKRCPLAAVAPAPPAPPPPRAALGAEEDEEQQRKDNVRRLAAIQQRLKEAELHKKVIQGALANLDTAKPAAGKHIVFGSDDDDDEDDDEGEQETPSAVIAPPKKTLFENSQLEDEAPVAEAPANGSKVQKVKPSGPQLFGGSDEEEGGDEDEEEEDGSRFDIRPQFEGRAGQKLMELQSRFGTDARFRMDSRFLEENKDEDGDTEMKVAEDDEGLGEEKRKNLSIMQSVLGSSQLTCSSTKSRRAKTFRDVSVLHYDPSKEEHAAFETKSEETKESKSARRKRREEAQMLPEVSKDIYYDVSGDLKTVFGPSGDNNIAKEEEEEKKKKDWDQEEEEEEKQGKEEEESSLIQADTEKEESGFKFSFFGDDEEKEPEETPVYKVENIQAVKASWQQDPRFQDSSSEEEVEDQEEEEVPIVMATNGTTDAAETKTGLCFFFLQPDDSRLMEGPGSFCRSAALEEQREQWEERRSMLRQEYRKKHKDARRKLKTSLKS